MTYTPRKFPRTLETNPGQLCEKNLWGNLRNLLGSYEFSPRGHVRRKAPETAIDRSDAEVTERDITEIRHQGRQRVVRRRPDVEVTAMPRRYPFSPHELIYSAAEEGVKFYLLSTGGDEQSIR